MAIKNSLRSQTLVLLSGSLLLMHWYNIYLCISQCTPRARAPAHFGQLRFPRRPAYNAGVCPRCIARRAVLNPPIDFRELP